MSNKDSVDKDLQEYLAQADNLKNADKLNYLRALFDKHFIFNKLDHSIIRHDLYSIASAAKGQFSNQRARPHISGKQVDSSELTTIAVIEAFIGYLNRNELLKRHVSLDYTDSEDSYEGIGDL